MPAWTERAAVLVGPLASRLGSCRPSRRQSAPDVVEDSVAVDDPPPVDDSAAFEPDSPGGFASDDFVSDGLVSDDLVSDDFESDDFVSDDLLAVRESRASFFAQPLPLKTIDGVDMSLRIGPPQTAHAVGPASFTP